ncbi:hypothetical protein GCM10010869_19160 [Mesorhizobium tianshanense]|nr:hypothetical protein GCM10010869_19160 [Mesorhizobium tianshanense]
MALNTASHAVRLLTARGLVVGEVGRGTFVRSPHHFDASAFDLQHTATSIDLSRNVLPLPGLAERFEGAARKVLRRERASLLDYHPHAGRMSDRAAAARWLSRNGHLPDDPSRIICRAQHALTVALMATTRPSDTVAVENLTWPGIQADVQALLEPILKADGFSTEQWDALPGRPNLIGDATPLVAKSCFDWLLAQTRFLLRNVSSVRTPKPARLAQKRRPIGLPGRSQPHKPCERL